MKDEYKAELDAAGIQAALVTQIKTDHAHITNGVKAKIVTAADATALAAAEADVDALDATSEEADIKAALQQLADVTAHKTGVAKFDMSTVKDELLVDYATEFDNNTSAVLANFVADIGTINGSAEEIAQLKAINEATTAAEVKTILDELAVAEYVNVPSIDKLHIAEKVLELRDTLTTGRDALKADGTASGNTTTDAKKFVDLAEVEGNLKVALTGVVAVYETLVAEFNYSALTDTATTVTQLGKLKYDAFDNLTAGKKALVAEKFVENYPMDSTPAAIDYTTLNAVKAAVDAAIAKVK